MNLTGSRHTSPPPIPIHRPTCHRVPTDSAASALRDGCYSHWLSASQNSVPSHLIQPCRNNKDRSLGLFIRHIQRDADFFLDKTFFGNRSLGKTNDYRVTQVDSFRNFLPPVLAGDEIFFVQPRCKAIAF